MAEPASSLLFLNSHRAKSGTLAGSVLHPDYVLLAHFFGCGPIDRTGTLDIGVPYTVLQEIPETRTEARFSDICGEVAEAIVTEALAHDQEIQVTWSGGIDSSVALIALSQELRSRGELARLTVLLTVQSMAEYPLFYEHFIMGKLNTKPLPIPLPLALSPEKLTVTGEHGDQLFGSDHLTQLVKGGVAHLPYEHVLPFVITQKLKTAEDAKRLMAYLAPQVERAPVPIVTAFDYIWWCNFSLKWQQVSLRMQAFRRGHVKDICMNVRHFFGAPKFQSWSLSNPHIRQIRDWRGYKLEAKQMILEYTKDYDYFMNKEKTPSLKHVLVDRSKQGSSRFRVHMYEDYQVHFEVFQKPKEPKEY